MGYTHYWTATPVNDEQWDIFVTKVRKIPTVFDSVPLAWEYDEPDREPQFDDEAVRFNGIGDDGHETFLMRPGDSGFQFCKTTGKPYDVAVTACLILANHYLAWDVRSDGEEEEWQAGHRLARLISGDDVHVPDGVVT